MKIISSSPHFHNSDSTSSIMLNVAISLTPAWIWGCIIFGSKALIVMIISILSSVLTEYILNLFTKEKTVTDFSALVTGILIGMNMSSDVPLFIPIIASIFAIFVVKWTFGGLGCNWANPAISGRIFVFYSFTSAMTKYTIPTILTKNSVIVSEASPLSLIKTAVTSGQSNLKSSLDILYSENFPTTDFAKFLSSKTGFNAYNIDAFFGFVPGSIGEISKLLLIIGGIYLVLKKVITIHIPLSFLGSFSILTWIFGGIPFGLGLFNGDVISSLLRGGLILGAIFMATDSVTSPITNKGRVIFGCGCGFICFLFRTFGSLPESVSIAILMMNIFTPTIDRFIIPKKYGLIKELK